MREGPLIPTRYRMSLRVAAVFVAYFIYRFAADARVIPGLMVGLGALLVAWSVIDEVSLAKEQRLGLLQVGLALLGIALLLLGGFLSFR